MNNEYNDYNKDDEYTPRHANDSYQNSSNDLIIDNNLNYIYTNADNILDTINNDKNNKKNQKNLKKSSKKLKYYLDFCNIIFYIYIYNSILPN